MKSAGDRKIVIIGLDNSGKTSIVLSLKGDRNLLSFYSLKPTAGIKVDDILTDSTKFHIWEFGGQQVYLKKYLEDFNSYTQNVDKILFVIDVQDSKRYDVAIGYFEDIAERFRTAKVFPEISLFLHKYDPNLEGNEDYSDRILNEKIVNKVTKIVTTEFPLSVFKTTIYTVFRKTSFSATLGEKAT